MHKNTANIIRSFSRTCDKFSLFTKTNPLEDRLLNSNCEFISISKKRTKYIRNAYVGETAYIISCGPSIELIWNDEVSTFLEDKLVIAIKQSHNLAPNITDFHLYNEVRMQTYSYPSTTVRLSCSKFMPKYPSHIHYPIHQYKWNNALIVTNEYEKWSLENRHDRPWGVGIMFEIGLYLPVYLGCRRALIMGFDMNDKGKYHFYDTSKNSDRIYYQVDIDEFKYVKSTIPYYLAWAKNKGLEVKLFSPLSALPIPQVKDIYSWV